jgi:hypothetical protein
MSPDDTPGGVLQTAERRAGRLGGAAYAFLLCLVTLAVVGLVGLLVKQPYLFPSLGPTVMLFFETPMQKAATPRNAGSDARRPDQAGGRGPPRQASRPWVRAERSQ